MSDNLTKLKVADKKLHKNMLSMVFVLANLRRFSKFASFPLYLQL